MMSASTVHNICIWNQDVFPIVCRKSPDRKNTIVDMGETRLPPTSYNALKIQRLSCKWRSVSWQKVDQTECKVRSHPEDMQQWHQQDSPNSQHQLLTHSLNLLHLLLSLQHCIVLLLRVQPIPWPLWFPEKNQWLEEHTIHAFHLGKLPKKTRFFWDIFPKCGWVGWLITKQGPNPSKPPKSPRTSPFSTQISPFVFPNLTQTLGWVGG